MNVAARLGPSATLTAVSVEPDRGDRPGPPRPIAMFAVPDRVGLPVIPRAVLSRLQGVRRAPRASAGFRSRRAGQTVRLNRLLAAAIAQASPHRALIGFADIRKLDDDQLSGPVAGKVANPSRTRADHRSASRSHFVAVGERIDARGRSGRLAPPSAGSAPSRGPDRDQARKSNLRPSLRRSRPSPRRPPPEDRPAPLRRSPALPGGPPVPSRRAIRDSPGEIRP